MYLILPRANYHLLAHTSHHVYKNTLMYRMAIKNAIASENCIFTSFLIDDILYEIYMRFLDLTSG